VIPSDAAGTTTGGDVITNDSCGAAGRAMWVFEITGRGFLWHQVRCMIAVLLLVGQKLEKPEVVDWLLDVDATPAKPQYSLAPGWPLLFYHCHFDGLNFLRSHAATVHLRKSLEQKWCRIEVSQAMQRALLNATRPGAKISITSAGVGVVDTDTEAHKTGTTTWPLHDFAEKRSLKKQHLPMCRRPTEKSYTEKVQGLAGSKKIRFDRNEKLKAERKTQEESLV